MHSAETRNQESAVDSISTMCTTCVQHVHASTHNQRTTTLLTHTQKPFASHLVHKASVYTSTAWFLHPHVITFCAQAFEHINRLLGRVIPIIHRPYKNKDFLNLFNSIIERQAV
jgi:hypothetical protein